MKKYAKLPPIVCYPGRLNQVFLNLLVNACDAIADKGEIGITSFEKDGNAHVVIRDTGVGIPSENLAKIFDPGFTTKAMAWERDWDCRFVIKSFRNIGEKYWLKASLRKEPPFL